MKSWSPRNILGWYLVGLLLGAGIAMSTAAEPIIGRSGAPEQKGSVVAQQKGIVVAVPSRAQVDASGEASAGDLSAVGDAAASDLSALLLKWAPYVFSVLAVALAFGLLRRLLVQASYADVAYTPEVTRWPARWEPSPAGGDALRAEYDRGLDELARRPGPVTPEWSSAERARDGDCAAAYGEDRTRFN